MIIIPIPTGYMLVNAQLCQRPPTFYNNCPICVILLFIPQDLICQVDKNMDNKSDDQFLIIRAIIDANMKESDEKMNIYDSKIDNLMALMENMMDQIQISNFSPGKIASPKSQDTNTVVHGNKKAPTLEGGFSTKMVAYGISNTRSTHQNSMNSSSRHNLKVTLLRTSRTSTTTPICVSMWCLDSKYIFLLLTSTSKDTLSLKNNSSQISLTFNIIEIHICSEKLHLQSYLEML